MPDTFPPITVACTPATAIARLAAAAKRGKLPGFIAGASEKSCAVEAYGTVFDHQLTLHLEPAGAGTNITFSLKRLPKKPLIFAVVLLLTIWPGWPMTDSMLRTWWGWYDTLPSWTTAAWYLPTTVLPIPFMWQRWSRDSHASALKHSEEQITAITGILQEPA
jgi:hypothetical protein